MQVDEFTSPVHFSFLLFGYNTVIIIDVKTIGLINKIIGLYVHIYVI